MIAQFRFLVSRLLPERLKQKLSFSLSHLVYFLSSVLKGTRQIWLDDTEFMRFYNEAKSRILLDKGRAYNLFKLALIQNGQPGDFAELGCYKCGSILFLSGGDSLIEKHIDLIDTFQGMPNNLAHDPFWKPGDLGNSSFDEIQDYCKKTLVQSKYTIHKGVFPQEINLSGLRQKYAFAHLDTDLYEGTLKGLKFFYERLSSCLVCSFPGQN